jgi:hypothetical protein
MGKEVVVTNKIFENVFVADPRKVYQIPLVIEELSVLPSALLKYVFWHELKIYLPVSNDKEFFVKNGLGEIILNNRTARLTISHYFEPNKIVLIEEEGSFIKNGGADSVITHEFFHEIDFLFGRLSKNNIQYLHEEVPGLKSLDWENCSNMKEKFAIAGESFTHPGYFWSESPLTHNKIDLFRKAPEVYKYFEQFFKNWEKRNV